MQTQEQATPRDSGLIPSKGIELSLIGLGVAILGFVLLFVSVVGSKSAKQPEYEGMRPLAPQQTEAETGPTLDVGSRIEADNR